jgi:uncharacterized protein
LSTVLRSDHCRIRLNRKTAPLLAVLTILVFATSVAALDVPPLKGQVNDYAGLMPDDRAAALERTLAQFESDTGHQIAVLTVPTLDGEDIEGFSIRVAEKWNIGKKGLDNGAILTVVPQDRKLRIEVGYGLEGVLPDAIANRIIQEQIVPRFRNGDFPGGIEAGVDAMMKVSRGEVLLQTAPVRRPELPSGPAAFIALLLLGALFAFMFGVTQPTLLRGAFSGLTTGAIMAAMSWMTGARAKALGILVASGAAGAYANHYARCTWGRAWDVRSSPAREGWVGNTFGGSVYGGGGTGGGATGSGGGGGFSGGGGGFGGGGASGGW